MPKRLTFLFGAFFIAANICAQENPSKDPAAISPPPPPEELKTPPSDETEWFLRWLIHPRPRGMLVNLPIIDTDPNRGTTVGVMPIWIVQDAHNDHIEQIHAPSVTYNKNFKMITTYRYYYYPNPKSAFIFRSSLSTLAEKEVLADYNSSNFLDKGYDAAFRFQYNIDGSNRFYGLGPTSSQKNQSDYTENIIQSHISLGKALVPETPWRVRVSNRFAGERIYGGKIPSFLDTHERFPTAVAIYRQQVNETRFIINYEGRDDAITTSRGMYLQTYAGGSVKGLASQFDYTRYNLDARYYHKWPENENWTTASQLNYEQVLGNAPFWLLPRLGGKYSLRAYGEGRYIDRGAFSYNVEHRVILHKEKMAGVSVEFEVAPFAGVGTVFDNIGRMAKKYMRPVYGIATRAIARPQVVGSIDFGVGQEGLAAFIDINYSF